MNEPSFDEFMHEVLESIGGWNNWVNDDRLRALYDSMRSGSVESATISSGNYVLSDGSGKVVAELGPYDTAGEGEGAYLTDANGDAAEPENDIMERVLPGGRYMVRLVEVKG